MIMSGNVHKCAFDSRYYRNILFFGARVRPILGFRKYACIWLFGPILRHILAESEGVIW